MAMGCVCVQCERTATEARDSIAFVFFTSSWLPSLLIRRVGHAAAIEVVAYGRSSTARSHLARRAACSYVLFTNESSVRSGDAAVRTAS
jgi:hypothetical protein